MSDSSDNTLVIEDTLVIYDRASRRRFIRAGAAFLLTGGAVVAASPTLAGDCDRAPDNKNPKQAGNGSDSDSGTNADPEGCGRRQDKPKITRLRDPQEPPVQNRSTINVVTVSG